MSRQLRRASRSRWKLGDVFLSVFDCGASRKGTSLVREREGEGEKDEIEKEEREKEERQGKYVERVKKKKMETKFQHCRQ